jgi:hypothetical protein
MAIISRQDKEMYLNKWTKHIFTDSSWHMTIGGTKDGKVIKSVEVFNWMTGHQCFVEPLPEVFQKSK